MAALQHGEFLEMLTDSNGGLWKVKPFAIYLPGTTTLATLYISALSSITAPNPGTTDANGMCRFYSSPGRYDLFFNTATVADIVVEPAPGETALTDDPSSNAIDTRYAVLDITGHVPVAQIPAGGIGPAGPAGPTGATGPAGPTGGGPYRFVQGVPATTWTIPHSLGYRPVVQTFDGTGTEQLGDIRHIDANNLTVTYAYAISGEAECR